MVASDQVLASQAGVDMLQRGGNAVDAAVATALAVGVVSPSSCGIGGGGFMLIYLARQHRALALDYREVAPAAASRDMFVRDGQVVPELSQRGGLAVAVPGEVAGLTTALHRYGRLALATVLEPAIRYARDGFTVTPHLAEEIERNRDALQAQPALARIFLHADGTALAAGETVRQPQLAVTLEQIATAGPEAFYRGAIATEIARAVQAAGGIVTEADLAAYRPVWRRPLQGRYRGAEVITMPPPSSGGGVLLEILGMLQRDDLRVLGHDSPTYMHLLAEAMQHAFADRAQYYGDPDFVEVPLARLLSSTNTAALRARIRASMTLDHDAYGSAGASGVTAARDGGTSHLSVMDADGNAVACTTTINTGFGSKVVVGDTGVILNNEMDDFSAQASAPNVYGLIGAAANAIAPRKRPLSSMTPTIVTRGGEPILALGGSGGPLIISATLQVLLNVLDFGLDATAAVAAPRIHDQWVPPVLAVEPGVPDLARAALARYGYSVKEVPAMAAVQVVRQDAGIFEGAADPRKGGEAVGW
ncbi:MAG TPA: gamma-glutamyltransferase [Candidatus Acidoferrales bacterium]|nr:gamma-glutamyltransferase [Candidatus Acidoferrales bacterium]